MPCAHSNGQSSAVRRPKEQVFEQECLVCGGLTREFHFGAVCCTACAAFFRRAVAEGRSFICGKGGVCNVEGDSRATCRGCRYNKCVQMGMHPESVQSTSHKNCSADCTESNTPDSMEMYDKPEDSMSEVIRLFDTKAAICSTPGTRNSVENFLASYDHLKETRKLIYGNGTLGDVIGGEQPFPQEVGAFHMLNNKALRIEIALMVQMVRVCASYNGLTRNEKIVLFKNYAQTMSILERFFLTMERGGVQERRVHNVDETFVDLTRESGYDFPDIPEGSNGLLDGATLHKLFIEPMDGYIASLSIPMSNMQFTQADLVATLHWALFDPDLPEIPSGSRFKLDQARAKVHRDWLSFYEYHTVPDGQLRINRCLGMLNTVNELAVRARENFHMLRVFRVFDYDDVVGNIFGVDRGGQR